MPAKYFFPHTPPSGWKSEPYVLYIYHLIRKLQIIENKQKINNNYLVYNVKKMINI